MYLTNNEGKTVVLDWSFMLWYYFLLFMFNISFFLLSDEGCGAVAEVGGANLQDDLGANPPSFAEVSRELQLQVNLIKFRICEFYVILIRMVFVS